MTQYATSTYTYDADGYRLTRTVNGVEYKYIWVDGLLMSQTWGSETMVFLYDEVGSPIGFGYRYGSGDSYDYYYYEKNLQGDIVGIFDQSGTRIVEYIYDAWGDIQSTNGQGAYPLGFNNPFRYRGYYFDYETNLYYLQSRYYDPVNGRFINPDAYITTGQGLQIYNMYAYCGNDPVNRIDENGMKWGKAAWKARNAKLKRKQKENYDNNKKISVPNIIDNQQSYPDIKYGNASFADVGCEIAAINNVLSLQGKQVALADLIYAMEKKGCAALGGKFGTMPWDIGGILKYYGVKYDEWGFGAYTYIDDIENESQINDIYILTYINKNFFKSGIHTVAVYKQADGTYRAYNANGTHYNSLSAVYGDRQLLWLYRMN